MLHISGNMLYLLLINQSHIFAMTLCVNVPSVYFIGNSTNLTKEGEKSI